MAQTLLAGAQRPTIDCDYAPVAELDTLHRWGETLAQRRVMGRVEQESYMTCRFESCQGHYLLQRRANVPGEPVIGDSTLASVGDAGGFFEKGENK